MKQFLLLLIVGMALFSCKTEQPFVVPPAEYKETIVERLVPYPVPTDSAQIRALLACDSLNNVILKEFSEYKSGRIESLFLLSQNELSYTAKTKEETGYVAASDTIREIKVPYAVTVEKTVKVNQLTKFQSIQITIAWVAETAILCYIIFGIKWGNIISKIKNLIIK